MRIISKFKDYYDCVQKYGVDENIVYMRETKKYENYNPRKLGRLPGDIHEPLNEIFELVKSIPVVLELQTKSKKTYCSHWFQTRGIIGFCGMLIPYYSELPKDDPVFARYGKEILYDFTEPEDFDSRVHSFDPGWYLTAKTWEATRQKCLPHFDSIFQALNAPIFVVESKQRKHGYDISINPSLNPYKFYKIYDAQAAYQTISIYMGNQLAKCEDVAATIPDQYLIEEHGFDYKTSFRNCK